MPDANSPRKRLNWRLGWTGLALIVVLVVNIGVAAGLAVEHQFSTNPELCASCHIMADHVESYTTGPEMDHVHYEANVGCKDCHSDYTVGDQLTSLWRYVTGDYAIIWQRLRVDDDMCLQCHISLAYHADRTDHLRRNPHLSHWPDLTCTSCHMSHQPQVDYCARCHDNGGQRMTGDPVVPRAHNPWAEADNPES
jgi:nitrate/TMAO reductase-like tetraheme cytochrome c subunit